MERFVGTWKQTSVENLEAFLIASGATEEQRQGAVKLACDQPLYEKIETSGDNITVSEGRDAERRQIKKAKLGEEFGFTRHGGSTFNVLFEMDGDRLVETSSGSHHSVVVREVHGNTMTHKMTCNGVTAFRKFMKI